MRGACTGTSDSNMMVCWSPGRFRRGRRRIRGRTTWRFRPRTIPSNTAASKARFRKGEYGAGDVEIWDSGTCDIEKWQEGKEIIAGPPRE